MNKHQYCFAWVAIVLFLTVVTEIVSAYYGQILWHSLNIVYLPIIIIGIIAMIAVYNVKD